MDRDSGIKLDTYEVTVDGMYKLVMDKFEPNSDILNAAIIHPISLSEDETGYNLSVEAYDSEYERLMLLTVTLNNVKEISIGVKSLRPGLETWNSENIGIYSVQSNHLKSQGSVKRIIGKTMELVYKLHLQYG